MAGKVPLHVELEDGTTWDVVTDQRDLAAFELQAFYAPGRDATRQRYMAYSASVRNKQTELSWPKFDAACVEVVLAGEAEEVDPTQPAPPGAR
jgi:hypothetical protein